MQFIDRNGLNITCTADEYIIITQKLNEHTPVKSVDETPQPECKKRHRRPMKHKRVVATLSDGRQKFFPCVAAAYRFLKEGSAGCGDLTYDAFKKRLDRNEFAEVAGYFYEYEKTVMNEEQKPA